MGAVMWVLGQIASAVMGYVASKVWDALVGPNGESQVGDLSAKSLLEIQQIIGAAFRAHDLADASAKIDTVVTMMHEFNQAPGQTDRLENATLLNTEVVATLMKLGVDGTPLFVIVSYAHVAILQTRFTTFRAEGEKNNARDAIKSYMSHVQNKLYPYWLDYVQRTVSPGVVAAQINIHIRDHTKVYYTFQVNGSDHGLWPDPARAAKARIEYINNDTPYGVVARARDEYPRLLNNVESWH